MLTGIRFAQMTVSAANHLENHRDEIDAMNVFPVPDGDTGKNMSLTMRCGKCGGRQRHAAAERSGAKSGNRYAEKRAG